MCMCMVSIRLESNTYITVHVIIYIPSVNWLICSCVACSDNFRRSHGYWYCWKDFVPWGEGGGWIYIRLQNLANVFTEATVYRD